MLTWTAVIRNPASGIQYRFGERITLTQHAETGYHPLIMKRIKYVSRFATPFSESELEKLGEQASEKNKDREITGVLLTSGGIFYQVIEGPEQSVDEIFSTIGNDPRHTDLLVLSVEEGVDRRLFPDWSMRAVNLDAPAHVRLLPIKILMEAVFEQQQHIDKMVWAIERGLRQEFSANS
jgi:hypothetical protein